MERETEFRELFAASYARVVGTVYLIVQDRARAEEITQDAFMQLLRHWRKVSGYEQPDAWVRQAGWAGQVRKLGERLKQWGAPVALAAFLIEPSAPKKVSTP